MRRLTTAFGGIHEQEVRPTSQGLPSSLLQHSGFLTPATRAVHRLVYHGYPVAVLTGGKHVGTPTIQRHKAITTNVYGVRNCREIRIYKHRHGEGDEKRDELSDEGNHGQERQRPIRDELSLPVPDKHRTGTVYKRA